MSTGHSLLLKALLLALALAPEVSLASSAGGYLLSGLSGPLKVSDLNATSGNRNETRQQVDELLSSILNRQGPDMRPLRDFRDDNDITVEVAKRAWQLMHNHAEAFISHRMGQLEPLVERALAEAQVSARCVLAARKTMAAAKSLDSAALQLLNAWGSFPPTGLFEGTYGDIGSFHGCLGVPEMATKGAKTAAISHTHYCTIAYRPVLPKRADYELIINKEPQTLLHLFDTNGSRRDAFGDLLQHAHYNHYVYYKFGTCFPIECSPQDVQKLARLIGRNATLLSGPVKCHSKHPDDYEEEVIVNAHRIGKGAGQQQQQQQQQQIQKLKLSTRDLNDGLYIWKPHMTRAQWISLLILCSLCALVLLATLVDTVINRMPSSFTFAKQQQQQQILVNGEHQKLDEESTLGHIKSAAVAEFCDKNNNEDDDNNNHSIGLNLLTINHHIHDQVLEDLTGKQQVEEEGDNIDGKGRKRATEQELNKKKQRSLFKELVKDYSLITNLKQFVQVSDAQLKNDILCINGIRCITMSWIIITHTMQYNDWSAFARTREIETHLKSLINQPLFNGSYLVDTFFLVSGLLTSFSSFKATAKDVSISKKNIINQTTTTTTILHQQQQQQPLTRESLLARFSSRSYLIGRYLRLTPQIMLVSLLFILLPLLSNSGGPHWYTITGEYSENCSENWWINLFHIQAFYRSSQMCNFVCWWISVDMLYHLFALGIILLILYSKSKQSWLTALLSCFGLILAHSLVLIERHYKLALPPNLLSTIPQTGAMWSNMTLQLFWTPYAHAYPFFAGFYLGYLMAQREDLIKTYLAKEKVVKFGWLIATSLLILQSYSTYFWVIGKWHYTALSSTSFYLISPIIWSTCLSWIIIACQYGYGGFINQILSCRLFLVLGKASYIVYLSHFLVLFTFFGSQNLLLEPTQLMMLYIISGNICLAMLLGAALCVAFEMPWLKTQRRLMQYVR